MQIVVEVHESVMERYERCARPTESLSQVVEAGILAWIDRQCWLEKVKDKGWDWERKEQKYREQLAIVLE